MPSKHLWWVWGLILNGIAPLLLSCLGCGVSFFGGFQHSPANGCSASSCNFGVLAGDDCVDHNKLWKILKHIGIPDHLTCLLRNLYIGQELTVRTLCGTTDWFKTGKRLYCHLVYLPYIQSTSCEMLGWMSYKLESRLLGEISTASDMQMISL